MGCWVQNYFEVLLTSVLISGLVIPKILLIAFRKQLMDEVGERKIHHGAVPRLGGIAFLPSILLSVLLVMGFNLLHSGVVMPTMSISTVVCQMFLLCSLLLLYLVGMADDLIGVRYRAKFIFQIICGSLLVISGLWIGDLYGFMGIEEWPRWIGYIFTVLVVIYVTNAINLIDGIDGLASGLSIIAFIFYSYVLFVAGRYIDALICAGAIGALLPFLYFNMFGKAENKTKIFMGDTGSLTIGLLLSYMLITVATLPPVETDGHVYILVLALAPVMVPCLDVVRVFLHRIRKGRNPFLPDKCHIHHKLLALGFVQWRALIIILLTDATFIIVNLLLSTRVNSTWIVLGDVVVWILINMLLTHSIRVREKKSGKKLYD